MWETLIPVLGIVFLVLIIIARAAVVVPQQSAFVVEYLGKYRRYAASRLPHLGTVRGADRLRHSLKESASDIPEQVCITRDNVQVAIDGILYLKILDPQRASYGSPTYGFAITQLAQTTHSSEIGKIDLVRTLEERSSPNKMTWGTHPT